VGRSLETLVYGKKFFLSKESDREFDLSQQIIFSAKNLESLVSQDPQKCLRWTSLSLQNSNLESIP